MGESSHSETVLSSHTTTLEQRISSLIGSQLKPHTTFTSNHSSVIMSDTKKKSKKEKVSPALELRERLFNCQRSRQHTLNLSRLELTEFPAEIKKFANLKVLNASKNQFVDVGAMIQFRLLEEFDMSRVYLFRK